MFCYICFDLFNYLKGKNPNYILCVFCIPFGGTKDRQYKEIKITAMAIRGLKPLCSWLVVCL